MSLVMDSKSWRRRPQLHGVSRNGKVVYVTGPRVGMWVWDSAKHPILQKIEVDVYQASLSAADAIQVKKKDLAASGRYTAAGIKDELKRFADAAVTPTLDEAKAELEEARRAVAERRSKIKPVAAESPNEPVSTMRKIEARTVLRTMQRQEIVRILAGANPGQLLNVCGSTDVLALCVNRPRPHEKLITRALGVGKRWLSVSTLAAGGSPPKILRASCAAMTSRRALNWSKPPEGTAIKERDRPAS